MSPATSDAISGSVLALLVAGVTVLYDCHVSVQDRMKRVPIPVVRSPQALILAFAWGLVAAIAFHYTDGNGDTLVDSVLGLKQRNAQLRGLSVGLTILVLIRSKLSSIKGAEVVGNSSTTRGAPGLRSR